MPDKLVILIVDDETTVRDVVRRYLEHDGYQVVESSDGEKALALLRGSLPDLIVLDVMLPGIDGFALTRALRRQEVAGGKTVAIPIILLTARTSELDRLEGFDVGADDYVVKPFSPRELAARVKAVLRRVGRLDDTPAQQPIIHGGISVDPLGRSVNVDGRAVQLTVKEFDLLYFLMRYPRQVFTRVQLLDEVWGYEFYGDDSTVTVHIRRLREKIEGNPSEPVYLLTVWGVGYKFESPSA